MSLSSISELENLAIDCAEVEGEGRHFSDSPRARSPRNDGSHKHPSPSRFRPGGPASSIKESTTPPPSFLCPISMDIMRDPVILETGHTYDRRSIEHWIANGHRTCPVTGLKLRRLDLTPNYALRSAIGEWSSRGGVGAEKEELPGDLPHTARSSSREGKYIPNILHGHQEIVWALLVHKGLLYSASNDGTVRVWDVKAPACLAVLRAHTLPVLCLAATDDVIISGSYDTTILAWKVIDTGALEEPEVRPLMVLRGHRDAVRALSICQDRLVSASYDHDVRIWDADSGDCLAVLAQHEGPVRALAVGLPKNAHDGDQSTKAADFFSASYDTTIVAWKVPHDDGNDREKEFQPLQPKCLGVLRGHKKAIRALVSSNGRLFSGSDDSTIRVWDMTSLVCLVVLQGHSDNVRVLYATSNFLFSGSWDRTILVWDVANLNDQPIAVLAGHTQAVLALTVAADPDSPDQNGTLVSGSYDGTLRFWERDGNHWRCTRLCERHRDGVRVLASQGIRVFSGGYDGSVGIW